ncbi:6-bladed beta-propeller [Chitinophaga sp. XS-30]|uniref:6-bladed beta-propeller n=1 Tax=Chitinophaga sp. XS-30 TaxID=2604421 RepID=UPI00143D9F30|nr:6-bladed beta-propeller [Chitinophaga sp. XS-30]
MNLFAQRDAREIRIDPDRPMGSAVGRIFGVVRYISLETTKESTLGRVDKLYVTDSLFIILDYATNNVFLFRKDGKFHAKINGGPKPEYGGIKFLNIDRQRKTIMFKDARNGIKMYDFDGNLLPDLKKDRNFEYFHTLRDSVTLYYSLNYDYRKDKKDSLDYELKFYRGDSLSGRAFSYRNYNKTIRNDDLITGSEGVFFETGNDSTVHFIRTYRYQVYTVSRDSVSDVYRFVFPRERSLPQDFLSNPAYYGNRAKYVLSTGAKAIFSILYFYKVKNLAFFRLQTVDKPRKQSYSFVYNLDTQMLYAVDHIAPDPSNFYLPIGTSNGFPTANFVTHGFLTTDGNAIYAAASSQEMFAAKDMAAEKNLTYSDDLREYFERNTIKSNPVIIQMIPK